MVLYTSASAPCVRSVGAGVLVWKGGGSVCVVEEDGASVVVRSGGGGGSDVDVGIDFGGFEVVIVRAVDGIWSAGWLASSSVYGVRR